MNLLTLLVGTLMSLGNPNNPTEWDSFKLDYGKIYSDEATDSMRREIFLENKNFIDTFNANADESSFTLRTNHLADWTPAELKQLNGRRSSKEKRENTFEAEQFLKSIYARGDETIPNELDWRKVPGRVTAVKNQHKCGSCWAFSTTGLLEGQETFHARNRSALIPLSEQNLVDCACEGCGGGLVEDALNFVFQAGGIDSEEAYPYVAQKRRCHYKKDKFVMADKGYVSLSFGDEDQLKTTVAKYGPVSVGIDASSETFYNYGGGVFYNENCRSDEGALDHAVLVVGYGTDSKQGDYWIVKNSWSEQWGEKGYIRMARNRNNNCGIATDAVIAAF